MNSDENEHVSNFSNWVTLPYPAAVEVYSHLCDRDRVAMSQVCRNWNNSFKSPSLWRYRMFCLNETSDKKYIDLTALFGSYLQEINIGMCYRFHKNRKNIPETMDILMENMKDAKLYRLETSFLFQDSSMHYSELMDKLTKSLIKLLQTQTELKNVRLESSNYSQSMGTELLNTLATSAGYKIEHLDITDFLYSILNVDRLEQLKETLTKFTNLTSLKLNYSYISDEVVRHWAVSLRNKLETLEIQASKHEPYYHIIRSETWRQLSASCPKLKVSITTFDIIQANEIIRILQANIPLDTFAMMVFKDETTNVKLENILKHLVDCFQHKLVQLSFFCRTMQDFVDVELVDILEQCRRLKTFNFFGKVAKMVPDKIYDMLKDSRSVLCSARVTSSDDTNVDPEIGKNMKLIELILPDAYEPGFFVH